MSVHRFQIILSILAVLSLVMFAAPGNGQMSAPEPVTVALKVFPITVTAGDYELVNQVLDFPPGSIVPKHVHGGPVVVTVISGQLTQVDATGERVVKAGESWKEKTGTEHSVMNKSKKTTRLVASYLIPKGASLITIVK